MILRHILPTAALLLCIVQTAIAQEVIKEPEMELKGHTQEVEALTYSPDGKVLVSGGWDNTLKIWNAETGELVNSFKAHDGSIRCMAFSRDSKMLITGSRDNSIKIWDTTWSVKYSLFGHVNTINCVLIDPSLRYAYSGGADASLKVWDLKKKGESRTLKKFARPINSIAVSIRGTDIYVATEGPEIYNINVTGKDKKNFVGHTDEVNALAYALNNKYLISGSSDKTAIIWNIQNGKIEQTLKGHTWKVTHVAFSIDSKFAITGSTDGTVKMWEVETGKLVASFEAEVNSISALALSPDITHIASAAMVNSFLPEDKKYLVYVWETGEEPERVKQARLRQYKQDSIRYLKDSAKIAQDSARRTLDSLKQAEKQKQIELRQKQLEEKKKREEEKKKKAGDSGQAIEVREVWL